MARRENRKQRLLIAARSLYTVNLRAHHSTLQQFVNEKIPPALKLFEDRASKVAQDNQARSKSLPEAVLCHER